MVQSNFSKIAFLIFIVSGCASKIQTPDSISSPEFSNRTGEPAPLVAASSPELLEIDHKYFKIFYDPKIRLARYVIYELTDSDLRGKKGNRSKSKFHADPILVSRKIPAVLPSEYKGKQGEDSKGIHYDQGHLAPAGDFGRSQEATDETFVMSNMAPQTGGLNRNAWSGLEAQVRKWACGEKKIKVITGPILDEKMDSLRGGLLIPTQFFKIIIDETPPRKVISFIYSQTDSKKDVLKNRIVDPPVIFRRIKKDFSSELPLGDLNLFRKSTPLTQWMEKAC